MQDFKKLNVWNESHQFVIEIYKATSSFPKDEQYGITSQLRRASTSIPTNIAEGFGRNTDLQILNFLNIASGSAKEVEYLLLLVKDLKYVIYSEYKDLTNKIQKITAMLVSLTNRIRQSSEKANSH